MRHRDETAESADELLRLACLTYTHEDRPARRARGRELLRQRPELADHSIYTAAALGRSARVRELLAIDPEAAKRRGGPKDWEPLLYLAYSRIEAREEGDDWLATAGALLDHGADPNASFHWHPDLPFHALTGVLGQGEMGPYNQPEHPGGLALARLLLERGADPNDSQGVYDRMFRRDDAWLALLLEFGLAPEHRVRWIERDAHGAIVEEPTPTMQFLLGYAASFGFEERVELLLAHGARADAPGRSGHSVWLAAMQSGYPRIAERLERAGAPPQPLDELQRFACAALSGDAPATRAAAARDPQLVERLRASHPMLLADAARRGQVEGLELLLELGFDPNVPEGAPPLHQAAWHGEVETARRLLAEGADPWKRDARFDATALDHARHGGHPAAIRLLAEAMGEDLSESSGA